MTDPIVLTTPLKILITIVFIIPLVVPLVALWGREWEMASPIVDFYFRWFLVMPFGLYLSWKAVTG
jgi:hypothetical protein